MTQEWFYTENNRQVGPVPEEELKARAAAGTLRPESLVWNARMREWLPAGQATDWTFGPAPATAKAAPASPTAPQPLAYVAQTDEPLLLSLRVFDVMRKTKPWVRFFGVLGYVFAGLFAVLGIAMIVMGFAIRPAPSPNGPPAVALALIYFVAAIVYVFIGGYLNRYASHIARLDRMRRTVDLEDALDAQRAFWKLCGILTIVSFVVYVVGVAIAIVIAA